MHSSTPPVRAPHRVVILALPSVVLFDLSVPLQIFGYPRNDLGARRYRAVLCGERAGLVRSSSDLDIVAPVGLGALRAADTVVIPGIDQLTRPIAPAVLRALRAAHERGARLVSICTGAFVLAEAGLLDGRRATTHWIDIPEFKARYPLVEVDADVLYVDSGDILTSAGIAAGIDLCLHVVRRDFGAALANAVARRLVIAPHRTGGQAQFIAQPVSEERGHALEPLRAWMLGRLADTTLTVTAMAAHAAVPLRTFVRHFVQEVGVPPLQWLLRQRVLAAQRLLETSDMPVARVAQRCGFGSAVAMRAHFRKTLETSPLSYRHTFRARSSPASDEG